MAKISDNKYLYRIMRFDHAVQVLKGELFFSHPSQWEDPYETHVKHSYDHAIFAQCWTTASMSDAMWRIYSPNFLGVRLRTKVGKLTKVMRAYTQSNKGFRRRLEKVNYLGMAAYKKETEELGCLMNDGDFSSPSLGADLLCVKRSAFEHENEVRAILFDSNAERKEGGVLKGIVVSFGGIDLIDSILFDPRAPDELCHAMRHYLKDVLGFTGEIRKSKLYTVKSR
ncbi:DUF2971 domain-containing protein [Pseudomonas capsici]|uniref:DUF2971 domain-containing protein n=1 Tax=Pseudomonas capsici TaxID=2810614 RepID=UPI0019CFDCF9|nr:DUF2971 domain-containing protein [Pseudomonas capsici]MBN6715216.1 DUF2971 domain-containing protein [Pseudomonas capsici]MBN6718323.1 DUF2971 domain-containing protein [Pseudomonas capsici]MBN6725117.1 DUF2971 domain-containing protein [Pseudomonas capsici]